MSKQPNFGYTVEPDDTFQQVLEGAAKLLFWAGVVATAIATAFLVYTYIAFSGGSTPAAGAVVQAESNISIFSKVLLAGLIAAGVGSTFLFWGEETLGAFQLLGAGLFYFAPLLIPSVAGHGDNKLPEVATQSLATIQNGGIGLGLLAVCVLASDIAMRIRLRSLQGARADQLKYGKGVKEERDIQNVFLGKCWQLPFCRKFVRERCPIYHAKRTCWRERVGCMCEEEVIGQAMANRAIPRDAVAAAKFIPVNNRLPMAAKIQRCKQCVIYNEHQKHKYRLAVPAVLVFYILAVVAGYGPLMAGMGKVIAKIDGIVNNVTYQPNGTVHAAAEAPVYFQFILLICIMVICFTYTLRLTEYLIFKAKV
jgi:hypothetical protein